MLIAASAGTEIDAVAHGRVAYADWLKGFHIRAMRISRDGTRAEVAWSALHGLATLQEGHRLRPDQVQARFTLLHRMLTQDLGPTSDDG